MSTQTLSYIFPYSSFSFNLDLNFLVLAQGRKSPFLNTDLNIPLRSLNAPDATRLGQILYKADHEVRLPSKSILESFRWYIQQAKRTKVSVGMEVAKVRIIY
jgi:Mini-chromosome maintenance replisome factor